MSGFDGIDRAVDWSFIDEGRRGSVIAAAKDMGRVGVASESAVRDALWRIYAFGLCEARDPARPDLEAICISRRDRNRAKEARRKKRGK